MTRAMKNSGVEWIGQIPESWNTIRLKMIAPILRGASPRPINDPKYFDDNGNYYWVRINDVTKSNGYLYSCAQKLSNIGAELSVKLEPNTLFISICATLGKPCITKIPCCIHDGFIYFYRLDKRLNKYLYYVFEAGKCFEGLAKLGTQQNLNTFLIGNIKIALPYNHKQIQAIANYLDDKCAQIDNITATINEQIEVLKQYKKSVITEAVTKGLDPNVPMKDSGVEWIGQIPEHWEVIKTKFITDYNLHTLSEQTSDNLEFNYIDIGSVEYGKGIISSQKYEFSSAPSRARRIVNNNDIILSTVRTYLRAITIIKNIKELTIVSTGFITLTPNSNNINHNYLYYSLLSEYFVSAVEANSFGIAYPSITNYDVLKLKILLPPLSEQQAVANYLDDKCAQIDAVIADKQAQLETLAAYKKSFIYEYVTGKKSVPGFEEA